MRYWTKIISYGMLAATATLALGGCDRQGNSSPVDMWNRSRLKPYEASPVFDNGNSSRPIVPGTIARGQVEQDKLYPPGMLSGTYYGGKADTSSHYNESRPGEGMVGASTPEGVRAGTVRDAAAANSNITPGSNIPNQTGAIDPIYLGDGGKMTTFPIKVDATVIKRGKVQYEVYCAPCHANDGYGNGMIVQRGFPQPPSYHSDRLRNAPVGHYFEVITNGYGAMYSYASRVAPEDRWAIIAYIRALQLSQNANLNDVPVDKRGQLKDVKPPTVLNPNFQDNPAVWSNSRDVGTSPNAAKQPAQPER